MERLGLRVENDPRLEASDLMEIARAAEDSGMESVWVPEGGGRDALSLLAAFAGATKRILLGTGILPIFSRTPAATAMSAAGMAAISQDRFLLGLGTGHGPVVTGTHGIPYSAPLARMEETVSIVRGLLAGESVNYEGRHFEISGARLGRAAQNVTTPIYVAALGPRMIDLAGRLADGVLLNWTAEGHISRSVEGLGSAAEAAGRKPDSVDVAGYVRVAVTTGGDEGLARTALQSQISGYAGHSYYRRFFESTGFGEEMGEARAAVEAGDRKAAAAAVSRGNAGPGCRGGHGSLV